MTETRPAPANDLRDSLPGDLPPEEQMARLIRVDHAGEYGAKRIYQGQLAILGDTSAGPALRHMAAQEEAHLKTFEQLIVERGVRPSALLPLWHVGGYVLGAVTALMGERAAMACTVAVEEVINDHYAEQAKTLEQRDPALRDRVETFRLEELEHRDLALEREAEKAPGYPVLTAVIKGISRLAIRTAERI